MTEYMRMWAQVPNDSQLRIRVRADDGVAVRGLMQQTAAGKPSAPVPLDFSALDAGCQQVITPGSAVYVTVILEYHTVTPASAVVDADVVEPGGTQYGAPFSERYTGTRDDFETHVFFSAGS
jgi:hypothetical protein